MKDGILKPGEIGEDLAPCPFCGRWVGFTLDSSGEPNGLTHVMPMCERFNADDPLTFIQTMNAIREGGVPS